MTLARAEEQLADPDKAERARQLVSDALANTKDTLTELRDLVRGIRPPALISAWCRPCRHWWRATSVPVELVDDITVRPRWAWRRWRISA